MVGRKRTHDGVRVAAVDERGGQRDRRTRIPWRRLDQDVARRHVSELPGDTGRVRGSGHHVGVLGSGQRSEAVNGGLQQRCGGAGQRVEEFRMADAR